MIESLLSSEYASANILPATLPWLHKCVLYTIPYDHFSNYTHCFFIFKKVVTIITITAFLDFNFVWASFSVNLIELILYKNDVKLLNFKGTLMQIWKSSYMFVLI